MTSPVKFRRRGVVEPAQSLAPATPVADFDDFFNGYIASTKKHWGHDRTKTLGGSEVFGCIRKAYYSRHNTPKDRDYEESWGATRRGDLIENHHVVPAMEWAAANRGFKIDYTGGDQQTLFADNVPMSVTPDGLIHSIPRNWLERYGIKDIKSDCVMFEIKSIDPRVDLSEEKSIHHGQTQIQMGLVRENTSFRPHYAVILYVNASFFDDMSVFIVEWDEAKYAVAKRRAHTVYDTASPDLLMREGRIDGSCNYCPFTEACLSTTISAFPKEKEPEPLVDENGKKIPKKKKGQRDSPPELVARLDPLLDAAHKARAQKKKAEKNDELLKEEVKAVLREVGERHARSGNWSLAYSMQSGRKTLDKERIEHALVIAQRIIDDANLSDTLDSELKDMGFGTDGQNEPRRLDDMEAFMKDGDPFEVLRMTFTEPDAEDL